MKSSWATGISASNSNQTWGRFWRGVIITLEDCEELLGEHHYQYLTHYSLGSLQGGQSNLQQTRKWSSPNLAVQPPSI